jgi:nucleoside-diphosphate-sugar epimerase
MVGRALVAALVADGIEVLATARRRAAAAELQEAGARVLYTDLANMGEWREEAAEAEVVFHLGLPRLVPPVRRRAARRMEAAAGRGAAALAEILAGRPAVVASSGFVYGDRDTPAEDASAPAPLALGAAPLAAERALAGGGTRVVRLPWVYGMGGIARALVLGLRMRRLRMVGPGANRWSLLSAADAAAALRAALALPPGAYVAAEELAPTQAELIAAICAGVPGLRRPDHVSPRFATFSLGGALAEALAASTWLGSGALAGSGWAPREDWREAVPALAREPELVRPG